MKLASYRYQDTISCGIVAEQGYCTIVKNTMFDDINLPDIALCDSDKDDYCTQSILHIRTS
jgi:hypothetical protein